MDTKAVTLIDPEDLDVRTESTLYRNCTIVRDLRTEKVTVFVDGMQYRNAFSVAQAKSRIDQWLAAVAMLTFHIHSDGNAVWVERATATAKEPAKEPAKERRPLARFDRGGGEIYNDDLEIIWFSLGEANTTSWRDFREAALELHGILILNLFSPDWLFK
jgi:hypothetical protein